MRKALALLAIIAATAFVSSCSDEDTASSGPQQGTVSLSESEITLPAKGRYYTIAATATDGNGTQGLTVTAGADWIELDADTVYKDGTIEFYAADNDSIKSRRTTITITAPTGAATVCTVTQSGLGDDGTNSADDGYFYVGYGYNIFKDYMNTKSLCAPIVDNDKAAALNGGKSLVQAALRSRESVDHITANSLYEMAELMTRQQDKTTSNLRGATKTVSHFESKGSATQKETRYCYLSLKRTVVSSGMDYSVLQQMVENGQDVFTEEFREAYDKVLAEPSAKNIDALFNRFGTHLVTYTEMGGAMDLAVNFSYEAKGELNMRAEDFAGYFFKHELSNFTTAGGNAIDGVTSSVTVGGTFNITGGSNEAQQKITAMLDSQQSDGRIDQAALQEWMNSLECTSIDDREAMAESGITPVSFRLTPVWSLFPANLRGLFLERAIAMSQQNDDKNFSDWNSGTDVYAFRLTGAPFMRFDGGSDQTLVRVVYASNSNSANLQPVLEVCNEYVPTIRGDRRITVVYAIKNGRTFHGAGLFPGDGEGNPPAWLTFSDGEVYVKPITGMGATDILDTVFYMHGNIYDTDLGIKVHAPSFQNVREQTLTLTGSDYTTGTYPIVKIGSGYWTRRNIDVPMMFGEPMDPSDIYSKFIVRETVADGILFANFFCGNQYNITNYNQNQFGYTEDNSKWYLPRLAIKDNLENYFGNNLKPLFENQTSGFDAQFSGYYGRYDDLDNGNEVSGMLTPLYKGQYSFLAFKDDERTGTTLVLSPEYTFRTIRTESSHNNYYPIRLYRSSSYKYE